ncbi:MAG: hypothetical protein KDE48_00020 [Anaerolineales bacterium]|nr:hypothetical protein [Anaerolineales bacterium]
MKQLNWQTQANDFAQKHNLQHSASVYALDLMSELGEVAKEILLASEYGQQPPRFTPDIAAELGDVLYSLCLLATAVDVDLETALARTLNQYESRRRQKGHPGSTK